MLRLFLTLKKGYKPETPILSTISKKQSQENRFCSNILNFFRTFYRDLKSNNIVDLDAGVFSNLANLRNL